MQRRRSTRSLRLIAAALGAAVVLFSLRSLSAIGAEPTSVVELEAFSNAAAPAVYGLSADGSTTFGTSRVDDAQGFSAGIRPVRWNATGEGLLLSVPAEDADLPDGTPAAASWDGSAIVGSSDRYEAGTDVGVSPMRWAAGQDVALDEFDEVNANGKRNAIANDVSANGLVICGFADRYDPISHLRIATDAVRWNDLGAVTALPSLGSSGTGQRIAQASVISGDGSTIGGFARKFENSVLQGDRPALWSPDGAVTELSVSVTSVAAQSGEVNAVSFDGSRAFGTVDSDPYAGSDHVESPVAVLWPSRGSPVEIGPRVAFADSPPYSDVLVGCSESGTRAVGYASRPGGPRGFVWTEGQGTVDLTTLYRNGGAYVGTSTPNAISADGSTVVGRSANGGSGKAFVWRDGQMRSLWDLIQAAGVDLAAEGWQTFDDAVACSADGSVIVGIGRRNDKAVAFRAKINDAPTLTVPTPRSVECTGGLNLVDLTVTANDPNSADRLTITWKVDGTTKQTTPNVVPGTVVTFGYDYPDGAHSVAIEVTDGAAIASSGTTVTVVDTTAPTIIVAADRIVPTDPGKSTASGVILTPPVVEDLCDGDPLVTNDAPAVFPLGPTIVKWTAQDDDGNKAIGAQRVTVVDREKPLVTGAKNLTVPCDRGQTFATVHLPPATATDNVPQGLKMTSTAKVRYPIGKSTASWTATDAAGNRATWSCTVTVLNKPPVANAGTSVTITTTSERGARATLDGSESSDADGHDLTYRWSAAGVRISKPTAAKTTANFPVGSKTVKLTVTDEAGAKKVASVRVTVKLKNAKRRPRGAAANAAFEQAAGLSGRPVSSSTLDEAAASARLYASVAHRLGIGLGDHVRWAEGQSPDDALLRYAEQRELQRRYGQLAGQRFLASFLETGDEASLLAGQHALRGVAHAAEDLVER